MAEMLVAVTIMVIVTGVVAGLFVQVRKMIGITKWSAETRAELRTTVNTLAADLNNIDSTGYFIMLNRDYGTYDPANPTVAAGARVFAGPNDIKPVAKRLWADRIAFVSNGPFDGLQGIPPGFSQPIKAASARIYYGQSLWTHDAPDKAWLPSLAGTSFACPSTAGTTNWPQAFDSHPAIMWDLARQAVLHVEDAAADYAGQTGFANEFAWRDGMDNEYALLRNTVSGAPFNVYTLSDLNRWLDASLTAGNRNWAALLWAPRLRDNSARATFDTKVARSRLLLPHCVRIRFQVRLSDGTIVPQTDDSTAQGNPWLQGANRPGHNRCRHRFVTEV